MIICQPLLNIFAQCLIYFIIKYLKQTKNMQTRQNKNYNLFTSLQTTFPKNDKQLISNELSPKKIIPFIIQNTDSQNLNVQNKQVLSWFVKKKAENKNKISNQPTPDFVIKNTFKSQCLEQKQSKNKIISNPAFDFLDAIQTVQEIDGNIFQQNNSQVHTSTECESQLNLVNKNYYKAEKKLIKKNKGFFINQHKNYEQPYKFNASVNNNFNLSIKEQQQLPINYRQDNPQRLELYPFIQKIDKNRIQSSLKAKQFEQKKKKQQSSQELIQISHTQKLKTFPSPKQVKRLLSSTQISKMHGHPLHMFKFHKSPLRLQFNLSPLTKKSTNLNIISHSQIKNKPQFLQKKSVSKVNQDCKYLPNNKIIILNVLSSKKQATAGLQILKLIADNNTSTIYLVRQIYTNCLYVLKKNQIKQITSLQFQFLIRQGKVGAKLDHPSLLKTYCTLYDKQNIYQLIQYMQGLTLYEKSPTQRSCLIKKYPPNKTKRITSQKDKYPLSSQQLKLLNIKYILNSLLEAVAHMHKQGVIHRDIKPSNIFISNDQTLKIGDFGSVGYMGSKQYVGTLDYVTPEVLTRQKYDYGVDIWSVGCIAYQLWTGLPPFYHQNREKTIDNIINQNFNRQRLTDLSLLNFIDKLLEKDPSKRITANQALIHHFLESYRRQIQ